MKRNVAAGICMPVVMLFAAVLFLGGASFAESGMGEAAVDLNTATVKELSALPGIGKKKAEAIIAYRTENSGFERVDEVKNVDGIGRKTFNRIRERIAVE